LLLLISTYVEEVERGCRWMRLCLQRCSDDSLGMSEFAFRRVLSVQKNTRGLDGSVWHLLICFIGFLG
jgi:hypothetical protein